MLVSNFIYFKKSNLQLFNLVFLKFFFILVSLGWNAFMFLRSNLHFEYHPLVYLPRLEKNIDNKKIKYVQPTFQLYNYNQYLFFSNFNKFFTKCVVGGYTVTYVGAAVFTTSCSFLNWISWGHKFKFYFLFRYSYFNKSQYFQILIQYLTKQNKTNTIFCLFCAPEYHIYAKKLSNLRNIRTGGFVNYTLSPWLLHYPLFGNTNDVRAQSAFISYCLCVYGLMYKSAALNLQTQVIELRKLNFYKKFNLK